MFLSPICFACSRWRPWDEEHPTHWCAAFPDGIPPEIGQAGFDHRQPFLGDRGIRFDLAPGKEEDLKGWEEIIQPALARMGATPVSKDAPVNPIKRGSAKLPARPARPESTGGPAGGKAKM